MQGNITVNGKKMTTEELVTAYLESLNEIDDLNALLDTKDKEIEELEGELETKEDLFKLREAISSDDRPGVEWYEERYQSDCIKINQLNTTIDVLTDKLVTLRKSFGL